MTPNPSLPSFFRDLASLLRALSEAIFVWPIFLSHHLWHSLALASPSGALPPVGPSTHSGLDKQTPGYLGSDRRAPRRTSRASRTRRDSTAKVRRDLTPTPATRSRSSSTPNYDRDATPTPTLARSGGDDLQRHLESANFTNITHTRVTSQPLPTSPPRVKAKHARHFSASTDGTFSASEPDSVRGNSSAGSSRSSSFSSESSYFDLFEQPTSARRAHFRPHSFGLSTPAGSDNENGNSSGDGATICEGSGLANDIGKVGESWDMKKRERELRRKDWEQKRLADAIERLQVSLLTAEEKEKDEETPGPVVRQPSPLLDPMGMSPVSLPTKVISRVAVPAINVQAQPKPGLRLQSPPSITIVPPPPQVYEEDMDDEEDMTPTPTVENAATPYRISHPHPSSNSSPIFIDPFASASSSTITLTSHNTSPTDSASPKPPSPKGSPTRRALKFLPGWDEKKSEEKRSVSPRLPALPSMKKLFGGHRGGKIRSHAGRTSDEAALTTESSA